LRHGPQPILGRAPACTQHKAAFARKNANKAQFMGAKATPKPVSGCACGTFHPSGSSRIRDHSSGAGDDVRATLVTEAAQTAGGETPPGARRGPVLLLEDEALIRTLAIDMLNMIGLEAAPAADCARARAALDALGAQPAAAMLDVILPDGRGDAFAEELLGRWPHLPVIVATGFDSGRLNLTPAARERVVVLSKPYDVAELETALRTAGALS
jgi:CheY-like chemotaxis protein